ncbi:hemerythrin domain-containing protein [Nocardioides sp.]|uniref:hemerythrin domain-containing protein n=1 Tax=Nocardioides sp. TaxID=35761 RepID=UPI0035B469C9
MTAQETTQINLPGQTHAAEGPHDQTGMYVMHHAFRRDLTTFEAAVRQTPVGDHATWQAQQARWERFATVLHHHHEVEDVSIWPVLVRHAARTEDVAAQQTLQAMEDEHADIDPALAAVRQGFAHMVEHPCDDHRNALDVHVTATRAALLDHLRHEETEALPYLQKVMTAEEFAASEKAAAAGYPPRLMPFLLPWVADGLPDEVVQRLIGGAGLAYAVALRLFRRGYHQRERRAFRYV